MIARKSGQTPPVSAFPASMCSGKQTQVFLFPQQAFYQKKKAIPIFLIFILFLTIFYYFDIILHSKPKMAFEK